MEIKKPRTKRAVSWYVGCSFLTLMVVFAILVVIKLANPILDNPNVGAPTLWLDTVKQGDMIVQVRGLATLSLGKDKTPTMAVVEIPESQVAEVRRKQSAEIDTRSGIVPGHVTRITETAVNGERSIEVTLDGVVPKGVADGTQVDGTITIETLHNVVFIGRPVHGEPNTTVSIFRLTPDGKNAERVNVKLGRASVNAIQILGGLKPGDRVILSDMSAWDAVDRVQIR